jgi:hypothetical protein
MIKAKNLGNYHPTIKRLFGSSGSPGSRKRVRGLKMGVGRFSSGMLKLGRREAVLAESRRGGQEGSGGPHGAKGRRRDRRR